MIELKNFCEFLDSKINTSKIEKSTYVSTENMIQNKAGICLATNLPDVPYVSSFQKKNILISNIRPYFKKIWYAKFDGGCSNDVLVFRAKESADSKFLYYILSDDKFFDYATATAKGTKMPRGDKIAIMKYSVPNFDIAIQKRIAGILGALDDWIDVLRRENVVLEQMAQTVFQSWFVDFDIVRAKADGLSASEVCGKYHITPELYALFPSALTPDGIPQGWGKLLFSETMKIISGGTPKTTEADFWNGNIPWYSVVDAPASVYVLDTEKHITQQGLENSPCSLLKKDTVIISARGTVGKLAMVGKEMAMNQSCYGLEFDFPYYGYLTTKQMLVYLRQNVHGAVFDTITKDTFKTVETASAPRALQENFTKLVSSFFEKIYKNTEQIRALSATRDALLPQLLGGKIDVENVPVLSVNEEDILKN